MTSVFFVRVSLDFERLRSPVCLGRSLALGFRDEASCPIVEVSDHSPPVRTGIPGIAITERLAAAGNT